MGGFWGLHRYVGQASRVAVPSIVAADQEMVNTVYLFNTCGISDYRLCIDFFLLWLLEL